MPPTRPYSPDDRIRTLTKALPLLPCVGLEDSAEALEQRIQEIRDGTCALVDVTAPEVLFEQSGQAWVQEMLDDLEDIPDLLVEWEQQIRTLCWLICVVDSEQMEGERETFFLQMEMFHPASPRLAMPGLHFHFDHIPVPIDTLVDENGLTDVLIHTMEESQLDHPGVDRDAGISVFVRKSPDVPDDGPACTLIVRYTGNDGRAAEDTLAFNAVKYCADNHGLEGRFHRFADALRLRFGI